MRQATLVAAALVLGVSIAHAQQPAQPAPPQYPPIEVGAVAPDFTLPGGTRYGVLREPIHLSDFHGKTVILAFFFRSRTRG
ncbi:MAG: hypothetical protein ACHQU1_02505 [Gemmatimonadales bacterium]